MQVRLGLLRLYLFFVGPGCGWLPVRGRLARPLFVAVALRRPRVAPGAAAGLAVRLVLVRAILGSKCECGFSLGLLAQAAFAIGFLDTSWDFNCCEVQKQN